MPRTGDRAELAGVYVDEHGHTCIAEPSQALPGCADGDTMWWHESLPVAKHMLWEAEQREGKIRRWADKRIP